MPPSHPLSAARVNRYRAEDRRAGARECIAHAAAVAEAQGEDLLRVHAEIAFDQRDHVVGELQVLAAGICPAVADALRRDEDGAVVRLRPQPVIRPGGPAGPAAVDVLHRAAAPVIPEDQPIGAVVVVVVGDPKDVAAALAAALNGAVPACQRRRLAASRAPHRGARASAARCAATCRAARTSTAPRTCDPGSPPLSETARPRRHPLARPGRRPRFPSSLRRRPCRPRPRTRIRRRHPSTRPSLSSRLRRTSPRHPSTRPSRSRCRQNRPARRSHRRNRRSRLLLLGFPQHRSPLPCPRCPGHRNHHPARRRRPRLQVQPPQRMMVRSVQISSGPHVSLTYTLLSRDRGIALVEIRRPMADGGAHERAASACRCSGATELLESFLSNHRWQRAVPQASIASPSAPRAPRSDHRA